MPPDVTQLLQSLQRGNRDAVDRLLPLVYDELRRLAHARLRYERDGHTLNTTALVHEAYLKLAGAPPGTPWQNRAHFFAIASRAMRQILVNYAKASRRVKRGGGAPVVPFEEDAFLPEPRAEELLALDEALTRLETINERQCRIVEYRYFSGLSIEETAEVLDVSPATVKRDWTTARAWLYREVSHGQPRSE